MPTRRTSFDLPLNDVKVYIEDLIDQLGDECTVDGVPCKMMISDLQRTFDNLDENSKMSVLSLDIPVRRGSTVSFNDGRKAIVYDVPNDDLVSQSLKILMLNSALEVKVQEDVFDENPASPTFGDILSSSLVVKTTMDGFVERLKAREKQFDVGILHDAELRFTTFAGSTVALGDFVHIKTKRYKVIDIDDIVDGLLVIQLASVRV